MAQFRQLRNCFEPPDPASAVFAVFTLFQELTYAAQAGGVPGRLPRKSIASLVESLSSNGQRMPTGEALLNKMVDPAGLLVPDGEDYICAIYSKLNPESEFRSMSSLGGSMRAFSKRKERIGERAVETAALLPEDRFKDAEGKPLDHELTKKVMMLIMACDNALFLPDRQPYAYPDSLIQNALKVVGSHDSETIDRILSRIAKKRNHPILQGITTDKLLADFKDYSGP